jgi:hypothetical protein
MLLPISIKTSDFARPDGFEPPTTAFEAQCSIQLSYGRNRREVYRGHYGAARMFANRSLNALWKRRYLA